MQTNRFYSVTLLFILLLLGYLSYRIMSPFFTVIAWAVVFSIVFYPVYAFISRHIKIRAVSSAVTVMLILMIIIGPFTYLSVVLINEIKGVASNSDERQFDSVSRILERPQVANLLDRISAYIGAENMPTKEVIMENVKKIGSGLIENLTIRITNIVSATIDFIFMIFTIFFLLKDGPGFLLKIRDYMPFSEKHKDRLASQVKDMVVSTVYGGVAVAVIQGILGGTAFLVLGVKSPVLWGMAMSVMSFVPLLGTFAIWGPFAVYFLIQGQYLHGIGLLLYGVLVISMVDNILKPLIIGGRTKMHTILIFFSVFGGIKLFGMIGLIMGPLIMAIFLSVFEIFRNLEGGEHAKP